MWFAVVNAEKKDMNKKDERARWCREPSIKMQTKHNFFDFWRNKRGNHTVSAIAQVNKSREPSWKKKLSIGMRTDLKGNDQGTKNRTTK